MAYEHYPSSWEAKESSEVLFSENEVPAVENNYSLCKVFSTLVVKHIKLSMSSKQKSIPINISPFIIGYYQFNTFLELFLQSVNFSSPFYTPPVILTTIIDGGSNNANIACPVKDPLSSWLEVK